MSQTIDLAGIKVDVVKKDIKNIHLSVYPPHGHVRISAPLHMNLDTIRVFAISKLAWIRQQQKKMHEQERETPREYIDRESHYVWGKRYLLKLIAQPRAPQVELKHSTMLLRVRPATDAVKKQMVVDEWYREQIKKTAPVLIDKWTAVLGVKVEKFYVRRMKTKWGGCNPQARTIRINSDLAKKPRACLEYIIVHEMMHMLEPTHNRRFQELMDRFMPQWRHYRDLLNRLPVRHERWLY